MTDQTPTPLPMCPMAETCKGMMEKPFSGVTLIVPGLVFIALGLLIIGHHDALHGELHSKRWQTVSG